MEGLTNTYSDTLIRESLAGNSLTQRSLVDEALSYQKAVDSEDEKLIENAAKEFEAVFLSAMLKPIFDQIKTDPPFGGGQAEKMFRGLMLQEYGKMIAETETVGISQSVKTELLKIQESNR